MATEASHAPPLNRNEFLRGRIVNWDEGEIDHGPYGSRYGRGEVVEVLESPFLLVRRIDRAGELMSPTCLFIVSMWEVRGLHIFDSLADEERWYAWHVRNPGPASDAQPK